MPSPTLSRRALISTLVAAPMSSTAQPAAASAAEVDSDDAKLIALGREFTAAGEALDHAGEHDEVMELLAKIDTLIVAVVATPAKTVEGLLVKARATAWAIEDEFGLFDPTREPSDNYRLAASIVEDLLKFGRKHK